MLSKQDRAMRAAYQDWAATYRRVGYRYYWLAKAAIQLAAQEGTE